MRTSSCRWVRRRLPLLAGGDLPGLDRRLTERHLIGCADCRRELEALRDTLDVLHTAAELAPMGALAPSWEEEPRSSLWPALERQIHESRRPLRLFPQARWGWVAAAAVLAVLVTAAGVMALGPRAGLNPRILRTLLVSRPAVSAPRPAPATTTVRRPRARVADLMERGEWAHSDEVDRKIQQAASGRASAPRVTSQ